MPFAQFLDELLRTAGYQTTVAKHGAAAFLELDVTPPDLILVDMFMPVIDGITFCRLVHANPATRHIPIVVMSAMPHVQQTIPVAIAGFLPKPLDSEALLHLVASLLAVPTVDTQAR